MTKIITLRLDDAVYRELREAADAERRSISNLVETAALMRVREQQFVDDAEMAELRTSDSLMKRLKAGSKDSREGRSQPVG